MGLSSLNNEGITELWKVIEEYKDKMLVREYILYIVVCTIR